MITFVGRREPLTYGDWRKLGWDPDAARALDAGSEVVEAFLYLRVGGVEERLASNTPAGAAARRRDEFAFEWGYAGSGPHETARAILGWLLVEQPARWLSQQFKAEVIAAQARGGFELTEVQIGEWADWQLAKGTHPADVDGRNRQLRKLADRGKAARLREEHTP